MEAPYQVLCISRVRCAKYLPNLVYEKPGLIGGGLTAAPSVVNHEVLGES